MNCIIFKRLLFLLFFLSPMFATVARAQTIVYCLNSEIWGMDMQTGERYILIDPPGVPFEFIDAPSWSPDGKLIAAVIGGNIWLADVPSRQSRMLIGADHQPFLGTPAWSKDGKLLYVGRLINDESDADGGLWQISVQNGQAHLLIQPEDSDLPIHRSPLVFADGHHLISCGIITGAASCYVIDLRTNKPIELPDQQIYNFVNCYAFDESSNILYLGGYAGGGVIGEVPGGVWRWDLTNNTCSPWILHGKYIYEITISPGGESMIISIVGINNESEVRLSYVYTDTGKKVTKIRIPGFLEHITWLDDKTFVAENAPKGDLLQTNIIRYNIRTGRWDRIVKGGYGVSIGNLINYK